MANIKWGKGLAHTATGWGIPRLPYGNTVLGNFANNVANNMINMAYNSTYGDSVRFVSASRHIMRRYVGGRVASELFSFIRTQPRMALLREVREFQAKSMQRALTNGYGDKIALGLSDGVELVDNRKPVAGESPYRNEYTGTVYDSYVEIKVPEDTPSEIIEQNKRRLGKKFVDATAIVDTSSKKNVVLTTVTGRDTTRKEYISGGDVNIEISGYITDRLPNRYPADQIANFVDIVEYAGILEIDCLALRPYGITHMLVTDHRITHTKGHLNSVSYSISAVGIAPNQKVTYMYSLADEVEKNTEVLNQWVTGGSALKQKQQYIPGREYKQDSFYKIIERWV